MEGRLNADLAGRRRDHWLRGWSVWYLRDTRCRSGGERPARRVWATAGGAQRRGPTRWPATPLKMLTITIRLTSTGNRPAAEEILGSSRP